MCKCDVASVGASIGLLLYHYFRPEFEVVKRGIDWLNWRKLGTACQIIKGKKRISEEKEGRNEGKKEVHQNHRGH